MNETKNKLRCHHNGADVNVVILGLAAGVGIFFWAKVYGHNFLWVKYKYKQYWNIGCPTNQELGPLFVS
jgi:hypothetical protein